MKTVKTALIFATLFGIQTLFADSLNQDKVINSISTQLIENILERIDSDYKEIGNGVYKFKTDDYTIILFNKNDDVLLYALFNSGRISQSRINEWNKTKRFSRAYLDKDDDPVLESDLDVEGGVTIVTLIRFLATFAASVKQFASDIE